MKTNIRRQRVFRSTIGRPLLVTRIVLISLVLWAISTAGAYHLMLRDPLSHADVLVVLAGSQVFGERARHAADLFHAGRTDAILLTNDGEFGSWSRRLQRNPSYVERSMFALIRMGVPSDRIEILPGVMHGTSEEAVAIRQYARDHRVRSLLVVTSPYHTRRAAWIVRRALRGDAITVGIDPSPRTDSTPSPFTWWATAEGWRTVAPEFVKLPYYWLRFRSL